MTLRKPIVVIDGIHHQMQNGDTLDAVAIAVGADLVNNSALKLPICTPVCAGVGAGNGGFQPARANAIGTARCIGLIAAPNIDPSKSGAIIQVGLLSASVGQWALVTGNNLGLIPGRVYWVSDQKSGYLTANAPTETGRFCSKVGQAITQTLMFILPSDPIGL